MTLTPQDIQSKQFHVRFRGFDVDEVDAFLEQLAENFSLLVEDNKSLKTQLQALSMELESIKTEEKSFKGALVSAQRVAEEMERKSKEEATKLLAQAGDEVEKLKDEAHREITELEYKVDRLRGIQGKLQDDLRAVIHSYLDLVDNPEKLEGDEGVDLPSAAELDTPDDDFQPSGILTSENTDISDLYEKIDIPDDEPDADDQDEPAGADNETSESLEDADAAESEAESEGANQAIPDMDDDFMFTLEDPLDRNTDDK